MCVVRVCEICSARSSSSGQGGTGGGGGMLCGAACPVACVACALIWWLTWLSRSRRTGSPCCRAVSGGSWLRMVVKREPFVVGGGGGRWLLLLASVCVAQLPVLIRGFALAAVGLTFWCGGGCCCFGRSDSVVSWLCVVSAGGSAVASCSSLCSLCSCCMPGRVLHTNLCMYEVSSVM